MIGLSPWPNGMLGPSSFLRSLMCSVTIRPWCLFRNATASWLAAVKWPMSRLTQMYSEDVAIAFSKSAAVAHSFGSRREWLWSPTRIFCFLATASMRGVVFWFDDAVITFAPTAFA